MNLNQLYFKILEDLWYDGEEVIPRGFKCKELINYNFILEDSNDNIITLEGFKTNINYAEVEYKWYCSGDNKINFDSLIKKIWEKYSDDGITAASGYGKQIFSQWRWIINELKQDKDSRRCVININLPQHKNHISKDIPCTVSFQILIRNNKLIWITTMRSNDVVKGLRNDIYCFTKLQQRLANELNVKVGKYIHNVGSIHLYEIDYEKTKKLLNIY